MFKLINALGNLIVRLYFAEARKMHTQAILDAKLSRELAERSRSLADKAVRLTDGSADIANRANELSKFFVTTK